jgi:hypothetical protein
MIVRLAKSESGVTHNATNRRLALTRRQWLAATATAAGAAALGQAPARSRQDTTESTPLAAGHQWRGQHWVGSWARGMHAPHRGTGDDTANQVFALEDRTVRQIVRLSVGGERVHICLSNTMGDTPLVIGAASVALRDHDAVIDPGTTQVVTFSGLPGVTIPANAIALSDPVDLPVAQLSELVVSLYFPTETTSSTVHGYAFQTSYISSAGDFNLEAHLPVETAMQSWVFLTGVDVAGPASRSAIVCLGDSITDGVNSTPDLNHRWPDFLADRLAASGEAMPGVLNLGIGGNRLLRNAPYGYDYFGPA